jgi:DNA modification methylase
MQSAGLRSELKARGRHRREKLADMAAMPLHRVRNDLCPSLSLVQRDPKALIVPARNARKIDAAQIQRVMRSISTYGFARPLIIDENDNVLDGVISMQAAIELNLPEIPCIVAGHLTPSEKRALRLAINRLQEKGTWDLVELKDELIELVDADIEIENTGFTLAEFDQITLDDDIEPLEKGPLAPEAGAKAIARVGDVYLFEGGHRVICGDATDPEVYAALMQGKPARLVSTDQPYNVPIAGHVTKGDHREFAMASGEMTEEQFLTFNETWIGAALPHLCDGGLIGSFIDWRGYPTVHAAAVGAALAAINLIVWAKTNAGLGSLYRSQHELFALYKKGTTSHINNIQLGKTGRWRSNVWTYPGASSIGSDSRGGLQFHPTVKPEAMCADAILDLTNRGEIVLDPFLGSGSTLIAAQRTGRRCFGIELDPLYVDVVIRRFQKVFGRPAVLEATGEDLDTLARQRQDDG